MRESWHFEIHQRPDGWYFCNLSASGRASQRGPFPSEISVRAEILEACAALNVHAWIEEVR